MTLSSTYAIAQTKSQKTNVCGEAKTCVNTVDLEKITKQGVIDAAAADYLEATLEQLTQFKADFYKARGQIYELNIRVNDAEQSELEKERDNVDLRVQVKKLTQEKDERWNSTTWVAIGTAVGGIIGTALTLILSK